MLAGELFIFDTLGYRAVLETAPGLGLPRECFQQSLKVAKRMHSEALKIADIQRRQWKGGSDTIMAHVALMFNLSS